jgi:hypothetical protein
MPTIEHFQQSDTGYQVRLRLTGRLVAALCLCLGVQVSASGAVNSPPNELIDELRRDAALIARINVQESLVNERSGNYVSYRVRARTTRLYRGNKPRGSVIIYQARAEQGTEDFGSTDRIVFLKRKTTASSQWYALEFGQFRYDQTLERRIQQRLNRQRD